MSNRIVDRLRAASNAGRIGIMPFLTAGYPDPSGTADLIFACDDSGAVAIEIGFPFSDPIADGPAISASMQHALDAGMTPAKILDTVRTVRPRIEAGLIAMVSESIVHRMGGPDFLNALHEAGFDGVIIPDLDLDAAAPLRDRAELLDLALALLIAPTSPAERAARIASLCRGFVYLLARTGLTGERAEVPDLSGRVRMLRSACDLSIAAGFGISTPEHVQAIAQWVDAAIVGSALVRRLADAPDPAEEARRFVESLVAASTRPDSIPPEN